MNEKRAAEIARIQGQQERLMRKLRAKPGKVAQRFRDMGNRFTALGHDLMEIKPWDTQPSERE